MGAEQGCLGLLGKRWCWPDPHRWQWEGRENSLEKYLWFIHWGLREQVLTVGVILVRAMPFGGCYKRELPFGFLEMGTLILEQILLFSWKSPG